MTKKRNVSRARAKRWRRLCKLHLTCRLLPISTSLHRLSVMIHRPFVGLVLPGFPKRPLVTLLSYDTLWLLIVHDFWVRFYMRRGDNETALEPPAVFQSLKQHNLKLSLIVFDHAWWPIMFVYKLYLFRVPIGWCRISTIRTFSGFSLPDADFRVHWTILTSTTYLWPISEGSVLHWVKSQWDL